MIAKLFALVVLACLFAAPASAQDGSCAAPSLAGARIGDYRPVFLACVNGSGEKRLATRRFAANGDTLLLTVEPQSLETSVERASCWRCAETSDADEAATRLIHALQKPPAGSVPKALENAGLVHGQGGGVFVTGDLCPSKKPLDRAFLQRLEREGARTPVALSISGSWLAHHHADVDWLRQEMANGALDISFVNHSYSHPYVKERADAQNYLLTPGVDIDREIFATEKLMIENGFAPTVFFRFPGLVSDDALMRRLRERHLITLGADAWVALGPRPRAGSIVLVHPNGNEETGLKIFTRMLDSGQVPKPLRRIEEAPPLP